MTKQQYQNWIRNIECNETGNAQYISSFFSVEPKSKVQEESDKE